jgi:glycosyltransferase involved in cell wall biosynthesis
VLHIQYQAAAFGMHPAINLLPRRLRRLDAERPQILVTFHDLKVPYLFPKAGPLRQWAIHELARQCDAVVTTNRADYSDLRRRLDAWPALIPIGSNIKPMLPADYRRDEWRARYGAQPGDLLLGFFGFVNDRKGLDTLLHALRLLDANDKPKIPGPWVGTGLVDEATSPIDQPLVNPQLLMIGGQTGASDPTNIAYLEHIQALIADLGLVNRVHWTGYLPPEEVSACFAATDMCVLPFRDGVSLLHGTLHAALAHGVPVLTTEPSEPIPELINGVHVLMVPREQPAALAEGIRSLAAAPQLRCALGQAAQELSESFRWDKIAAETLRLYRSVSASEATVGGLPD